MMKIIVHSRMTIAAMDINVPHLVISITDAERPWAIVPESEHCRGVLQMHFHDADRGAVYRPKHILEDDLIIPKVMAVFDENMASKMIDFVLENPAEILVCQCDAGISRSAGVAAAFGKILNKDDTFIFDNPRYNPNRTVYRTILETYYTKYVP